MPSNILFLTLRTFSATGGIEKVCRIIGKALYERSIEKNDNFELCSMYDRQEEADDNLYFPAEYFRGFSRNRISFIKEMVRVGAGKDIVILSHVNLLMVGWLIKKMSPKTKLILLAHGIEIWYPVSAVKKMMLNACDQVLAVSSYTKEKIMEVHGLPESKCSVLNNCLDPFLPLPSAAKKNAGLLKKYGFDKNDQILMTLTRLSSKERYKGYDKVIAAMAGLKSDRPIKYLVAGSYDQAEKEYLERHIREAGLQGSVVMSGFVKDEELEDHFAMADVYIMPSRKEGFGIVFIEAMYYGLPVIAGNIDGSVDALLHGQLGQLVNPDDIGQIRAAIELVLADTDAHLAKRDLLKENFGYDAYKKNMQQLV